MRAVSTRAFNAIGISAPEAGVIIETSAITLAQLKNIGFVEIQDQKLADSKIKKAKKK